MSQKSTHQATSKITKPPVNSAEPVTAAIHATLTIVSLYTSKGYKTHRTCNILVSIILKDKRLSYDTKTTCAHKAFYLYSVWSQSYNLSVLYVCVSILVYAYVCIAQQN